MLISGVIKGLAEELDMPLNNRALAKGCPSRRTISRAEKRLAGACLIHTVKEIKKDKAEWIALVVDHGKRNGIEQFVKLVICGPVETSMAIELSSSSV